MNIISSDFGHQTSDSNTPKKQGYAFPAEWTKHEATWLSWPHKEESWPGKIETIYEPYCQFIKLVATGEKVRINVRDEEMKAFALQLAENMRKVVVSSNDIAGFIGNGHFMRDALYGIAEAEKLSAEMPLHEAIYAINRVTQDYLMRPMGIFQLIDYVGVDVVRFIMNVMNPYMPAENLHSDVLDAFFAKEIKGGQFANGSQKDGILKYEKGRAVGVYSLEKGKYILFDEYASRVNDWLGTLPSVVLQWKNLVKSPDKNVIVEAVFAAYKRSNERGCNLALDYARRSRDIGRQLLSTGVALSVEDVNTVMLTGFFHAYGPVNDYVI